MYSTLVPKLWIHDPPVDLNQFFLQLDYSVFCYKVSYAFLLQHLRAGSVCSLLVNAKDSSYCYCWLNTHLVPFYFTDLHHCYKSGKL